MRILCTYSEYDRMEEIFEGMFFKADDFVPSEVDLEQHILPKLDKYVPFLLWIDLTGYDTDENYEMRKRIRAILRNKMELVDEIPEEMEGLV